jgi:transcriptional regulator with XRE-family HTH domain
LQIGHIVFISCPISTENSLVPSEQELAQVLGSRVKELREGRGWSEGALSQQLRISRSMVAKYKGGVHSPTVGVLVRLARAAWPAGAGSAEERDQLVAFKMGAVQLALDALSSRLSCIPARGQ